MSRIDVPEDLDDFNEWAMANNWGDGLPLVLPTVERVERMARGVGLSPDFVIGTVPLSYADASLEKVAINAVLAGCEPRHMPILVAAVEAMLKPEVNLYGAQSTTHPCAMMVMVNGPAARAAGLHCGAGAFGPGFRSNATIGRAVRLILQNIGGARASDTTDRATQGGPAKFTFCFAENEADSPWPPYHVDLGFNADESTVTVVAGEGPHNIENHARQDSSGVLLSVAHTIATLGNNNAYIRNSDYFVAFGPEHARILADGGFTKRDVQEYLYERARIPYRLWRLGGLVGIFPQPRYMDVVDDDFMVPMSDMPDDVHLCVVGGVGKHSSFIPTVGIGRSATVRVNH